MGYLPHRLVVLPRSLPRGHLDPRLRPVRNLVKDINVGAAPVASSTPTPIYNSGAIIYMAATSRTSGNELYQTFGSTGSITLVKDINPGPGNSYPSSFITVGGTTYFGASDGVNGHELWKTDGSAAGTVMVKDITTSIGSGCDLYVDPTKSPILLFFTPANDGSWMLTNKLPNSAAAVGTEVMLQVGYGPSGTLPLGVDLSPGMKLTLGY